jgi:hypothetical protein
MIDASSCLFTDLFFYFFEGDLSAIAVNAAIKDHQFRQKKVLLFSHPFNNGHVRYLGEGCYKSHKILTFLRGKSVNFTAICRSQFVHAISIQISKRG